MYLVLIVGLTPLLSVTMDKEVVSFVPQRASAARAANVIVQIVQQELKQEDEMADDALWEPKKLVAHQKPLKHTGKRKLENVSNAGPYECQIEGCNYVCATKENLPRHWHKKHKLEYLYQCSVCKKKLKDFFDYTKHGKAHLLKQEAYPQESLLRSAPWYPILPDIKLKNGAKQLIEFSKKEIASRSASAQHAMQESTTVGPLHYIVGQGRWPMREFNKFKKKMRGEVEVK